jgi:ATP-dependent DNA ligase
VNTHDLYQLLRAIAETSATSEKLALLETHRDDPLLKYVVWAAYEPTRNYYIKNLPRPYTGLGRAELGLSAWATLDELADRRVIGDAAKRLVQATLDQLEPESAEIFTRILKRDLRIGVAAKGFDKVFPGLLTRFDVMLAAPYTYAEGPVLVSPKIDGMRVLARVDRRHTKVDFFTRNGKLVETLNHVADTLLRFEYPEDLFWVDGEGTAPGGFAESISSLRRKVSDAKGLFNVFDILPGSIETERSANDRYEDLLKSAVAGAHVMLVPSILSTSHDQTMGLYAQFREQGYEGAIVKDPGAGYQLKRSKAWMKIKPTETLDLPVVSAFEGTGKYVGKLGGLTVNYNGVRVNVGSGFSDQDREVLWSIWRHDPEQLLGRILEVSFHEVTTDGSLRHPRAKRFRPDK